MLEQALLPFATCSSHEARLHLPTISTGFALTHGVLDNIQADRPCAAAHHFDCLTIVSAAQFQLPVLHGLRTHASQDDSEIL